jgi:pimeloyl-ACP methyl ester carboxylesterase
MAADGNIGSLAVNGIRIEMIERGSGWPLLFLHPGIGIAATAPALDRLAERARVLAPSHPGFGGSEQPAWFNSIEEG